MLTEKEIAIQLYLHERESELGNFILRCMAADVSNRAAFIKSGMDVTGLFIVTPQEELFADFFNNEKILAADMSILELRAHREELSKIAFEARARLTAVDDEERTRKAKAQKEKGPTGFSTSLQTDEITTNAINRVRERQKKLTKQEKTVEGLVKMGMDRKEAEKLVSAGTILARLKEKIDNPTVEPPSTPFMNPFGPKTPAPVEVNINEDTNAVIIKEEQSTEPTKPTFNPFKK